MKIKKITHFLILVFFSFETYSKDINKVTYASWDKPDVELLYTLPKVINKNTKVIFIIHGSSRDAKRYLNAWEFDAKNKNVIFGKGEVKFASIFEALKKIKYRERFTIESQRGKNIKNQATENYIFFKKLINQYLSA